MTAKIHFTHGGKTKNALGLMSGTSCDGLDIAWIEIEGHGINTRFEFKAGRSFQYSDQQKTGLLQLMQGRNFSAKDFSQLNFYLAEVWAEMVQQFLAENNISAEKIDFIGSHGQTIWHQPDAESFIDRQTSSTFQLGDPSVLAQLCGIPAVGDFRAADMALGGQGAPLIPYFDWIYFSKFKKNILALNIGGISNVTLIPADGKLENLTAFDCGPGNMLIDRSMEILFGQPFDENGKTAFKGRLSQRLFSYLKDKDTFADVQPPKSTGRELYSKQYLDNILAEAEKLKISREDIIHTISRYTAYAIFNSYQKFIKPASSIQDVAAGGGGAHNSFLMESLQDYFSPAAVSSVSEFGLDEDFKEAAGFAVLANETFAGQASNVMQVTGASRPAVLGRICLV